MENTIDQVSENTVKEFLDFYLGIKIFTFTLLSR